MNKSCLIIVAFLISHLTVISGDKKWISSISSENKSGEELLLDSAEYYQTIRPERALDYAERYLKSNYKSKKRGVDYASLGRVYQILGHAFYGLSNYEASISNYKRAIDNFNNIQDENGAYNIYKVIGASYVGMSDYYSGLEYYFTFLEKARNGGKLRADDIVFGKEKVAEIYRELGKYDKAIETYQEVFKLYKGHNNPEGMILTKNSIGEIYLIMENTDQALIHLSEAKKLAEKHNSLNLKLAEDNIGKVYQQEKNYPEVYKIKENSISRNKELNDTMALQKETMELAKILINQKNYTKAIQYLKENKAISEQLGDIESTSDVYKLLGEVYNELGFSRQALKNFNKYSQLEDSLKNERKRKLEDLLAMNESVLSKGNQIDLLQKDNQIQDQTIRLLEQQTQLSHEQVTRQKVISVALGGGLIAVIIAAYFLYRGTQQKKIANQLLALRSLRTQMNPHFIFNALNSVNSFIAKNDEKSANKYLASFSKLMRSVMENSKYDLVPLASEIKIIELYLHLEHFRFKEKFDYSLFVDEDIDEEEVNIPPMLIQPYIENSVWHGLRYKEDKGYLKVSFKKNGQMILCEIEDNGIGRKKSIQFKTKNQKENVSTGLKNIESRLSIINEVNKTELKVEIIDIEEDDKTGTLVKIYIPIQN